MIITIDGPTASGKSTVACELARSLNFYYLNTGMLYRALAYLLVSRCDYTIEQLSTPDVNDLSRCLDPEKLSYCYFPDGSIELRYDGVDITPHLKTSEMDQAASIVSGNSQVRAQLLDFQQKFAREHSVVAEGRDVGTVVFPQAEIKLFLTASLEERARRWQRDRQRQGELFTFKESKAQITKRDSRDEQRAIAPLAIPEGAITVDSTGKSKERVVHELTELVRSIVAEKTKNHH